MKAVVFHESSGTVSLAFEDVPKPTAQQGQVLVRLQAAALNRRDVLIRKGTYPLTQDGAISGSDGCGTTPDGQHVIICPSLGWASKSPAQPPDFQILGNPPDGTFAQYIAVDADLVFPKPVHLTVHEAAAVPLAALTAYRAMHTRAKVQPGETVLIAGIGSGVSCWAAAICKALGAKVYITSGQDAKLNHAKDLKLTDGGVNYKQQDWKQQLRQLIGISASDDGAYSAGIYEGFDVVMESLGGPHVNDYLSMVKAGGRYVFFGGTAGHDVHLKPQDWTRIYYGQISLLGTTMGSLEEFRELLDLVNQHKLKPVLHKEVFALKDYQKAYDLMEEGSHMGKIVLEIPI